MDNIDGLLKALFSKLSFFGLDQIIEFFKYLTEDEIDRLYLENTIKIK